MDFNKLLDPATTLGAFLISAFASLVVGVVLGFFSGKAYQKNITIKNKNVVTFNNSHGNAVSKNNFGVKNNKE